MQLTLLLTVLAVCSPVLQAGTASYHRTGSCTSNHQACAYKYHSTQSNFDGEQRQTTKVQATVDVRCSSVGTHGVQRATRYCMSVKDVTVSGDLFKGSSTDEVLDDTEEKIPELDPHETVLHKPPISPEDKLMSQWFCFVQTADGKVVAVEHPAKENVEVVNFKKGIAAAFQANFKGTTVEEEEDTSSLHRSSYRYISGTRVAYRSVNTKDVIAYAGGTPTQDVKLTKNEYIRYDHNHWLSRSSGSASMILGVEDTPSTSKQPSKAPSATSDESIIAQLPQYRNKRAVSATQTQGNPEPSTYDASADITEFKASGQYRLIRVRCTSGSGRSKRDLEEDTSEDVVTDSLGAKINHTLVQLHQLNLLRQKIPSVKQLLETLHKDPDNLKLANLLHRLLDLESEHKPLPGYEPALSDVLAYLPKLKDSRDKEMRKLVYSLLSPEGSFTAQKALHDAFVATDDKEERNALISYIAFANTPHLKFIKMLERLIDVDVTSSDPLLLAYGSLASSASGTSSSDGTEEHIVTFLLHRLNEVEKLSPANNTWPLVHLIHSLGNTESKLVIDTLLKYLIHNDLDVQLAAIGALRVHTTEQTVQEAFSDVLQLATMEEQVEQITRTLIDGLEHMKLNRHRQHDTNEPSEDFLILLVSATMQSNNSQLHELVLHYLQQLDSNDARQLMDILRNFMAKHPGFEEGEVYYIDDEVENGTAKARLRRGSDWDAANSIYNLVASYAQRRNDVSTYPKHKAYIWGKKFGLKKVYAQIAAGGFAGLKSDGSGYKLFAKAIAQGHAFGKTATALHAEFLRRRSGSSIYQKIYAKVVGKTLINEAGTLPLGCNSLTKNLLSTSIKIFRFKYSVFIYVGTLDFYIAMYAKLGLNLKVTFCETTVKACATLIPYATLRAEGGASATILLAVRGGIEVAAQFTYQVEPEVCIQYCKQYPGPTVKLKACINVYHSWPNNYAEIYAYYQLRKVKLWPPKITWGSKKKWKKLSKKWNLPSMSRKKIWGSCDPNIKCTNLPIKLPTPRPTVRTIPPSIRPTIRTIRYPTPRPPVRPPIRTIRYPTPRPPVRPPIRTIRYPTIKYPTPFPPISRPPVNIPIKGPILHIPRK